ncbi:Serine/threonine-protein kinase PknA [Frondihabitans sp. 762G35]|uniref:serine/threonine-protein kinase n=1 Tax=Frondihabitans sp. 762G35 TaxID=1446794 RepID=UPI000D21867A|nr:serine/threonine-protein kinase [Frondihabitans sp. 762G35]ARC57907.1 Serine/threonine-protein kinase PknA [Frondihabitans sp. 762G35]
MDDTAPAAGGARPELPVTLAGRYRLEEVLGSGGMSTVYRGVDETLGRRVAVKVLSAGSTDPTTPQRERSEIRLLASLAHAGLVTLYDADTARFGDSDRTYLVMELVDGPSLGERLRGGALSEADARLLLTDLAEALAFVHARGIVHRDIKPANVLLAPSGRPGRPFSARLADFGIASLLDSTRITQTGTVVGTAAYLSPEQAAGRPAGTASDIYATGLVLIESLTGERVFPGTLVETLGARLARDPEVPGHLGYRWKSLLGAMTLRDPEARPTAVEVLDRLQGLERDGAGATAALTLPGLPAEAPSDATAATRALPDDGLAETRRLPASPAPVVPKSRRRRRPLVWLAVVGAVAAVALVVGTSMALQDAGREAAPAPSPSRSASTAPVATTPASTAPSPETVGTTPAPSTPVPSTPVAPTVGGGDTPGTGPAPGTGAGNGPGNGNGKGPGNGKGNGNGNGKNK